MKDPYVLVIPPVRAGAIPSPGEEEAWAAFIQRYAGEGVPPDEIEGLLDTGQCFACHENHIELKEAEVALDLSQDRTENAEHDLQKLEEQLRDAGLTPVTVS